LFSAHWKQLNQKEAIGFSSHSIVYLHNQSPVRPAAVEDDSASFSSRCMATLCLQPFFFPPTEGIIWTHLCTKKRRQQSYVKVPAQPAFSKLLL